MCDETLNAARAERYRIAEVLRWRIVQLEQTLAIERVGVCSDDTRTAAEALADWDAEVGAMVGDGERVRAMLAVLRALKRDYPDAPQACDAEAAMFVDAPK